MRWATGWCEPIGADAFSKSAPGRQGRWEERSFRQRAAEPRTSTASSASASSAEDRSTRVREPGQRPEHGFEHALMDHVDAPHARDVLDPITRHELLGAGIRFREAPLEPIGVEQLLGAAARDASGTGLLEGHVDHEREIGAHGY